MPKLTKSFIDKVQPPASGYEIHWDGGHDSAVKGYGLRVTATGVRAFVAQGRVNGKAVIITIGKFGLYTEAQARDKAQSLLQQMREGIDPRAVKKQQQVEGVTLGALFENYLSRPGKLKESTKTWYRFFIDKTFKDWADKPVVSITRDMVKARHAELVKDGLKGKKVKGGAPASANSAMVVLRIILNYAADEHQLADGSPLIASNPVRALKRHWAPAGDRTDRYIPFDKVGEVWNALHDARLIARNRDTLAGVNFVLFLLTTGARRSEAASLLWSDVHIDRDDPAKSYWFLGDRKQGKPIMLPLSTATAQVLDACEKVQGNDHVFPRRGRGGHITDPRAILELVDKVAGRIVGAHGLRKTLSNISQRECRIEKFRTDLLLGHKPAQSDVTSRAYLDLHDLRWLNPEIEAISSFIVQQGLIAAGKNVVPMARPA